MPKILTDEEAREYVVKQAQASDFLDAVVEKLRMSILVGSKISKAGDRYVAKTFKVHMEGDTFRDVSVETLKGRTVYMTISTDVE